MHNYLRRGFTLIELLVVIAIIGLLASIVLASLNTARTKGRDARRFADLKSLQTAIELYYDACNSYPSSLAVGTNNNCPAGTTLGTFISKITGDPRSGAGYAYTAYGAAGAVCTGYHLGFKPEQSPKRGVQGAGTAGQCTGGAYGGAYTNGDGTTLGVTNGDFDNAGGVPGLYDIKQ